MWLMKKFRLLAAIAVLAMFMTSCEMFGEGGLLGGEKKARFTAYTETPDRTTMGENYTVVWSEGDQIVMFGTDAGAQLAALGAYALVEGAGTTTGVFEGNLPQEYPLYTAFYPLSRFEQGADYEGNMLVSLPYNDAIFAERNFVDGANPMAAIGTKDGGLQFRNLCGILEIQLKGSGTVNSIKVEVGAEDPYISGYFVVEPSTASLYAYSVAKFINATLATPIELSATTARSVYAILPPGEYKDLRITTIDNSGNTTTRKATTTINVVRSKITPVSEFEHQTVEAPSVSLTYLEEKSNFARAVYKLSFNAYAAGAYRYAISKSYYEELIGEGKTDAQLLMEGGTLTAESGDYSVSVHSAMGREVYLMAAPCDEQGNISGEIVKCSFVVKGIPVNNDYSITYKDSEVTNSSININFDAVPAEGKFAASLYTAADYNVLAENYKELYSVNGFSNINLDYAGGVVNLVQTNLMPNTEYVLVYRVANGVSDGVFDYTYTGYSARQEYTFKTAEYNKSNAAVQMRVAEVKDWSVTVNFTTSNAEKVKVWYTTAADVQDLEYSVDLYGTEVDYNAGHTFTGLVENTTYYIYAVAYDANGVYGDAAGVTATTTDLTPEQNSEYDKFIGTYTFSAIDFDTKEAAEARTVTISKGVDGKTLLVKGLLMPRFAEQYGVADDTLVARFYDNMIHIGGSAIADMGQTLTSMFGTGYSIYASANSSSGYYWPGNTVSSAYNNGAMTFVNLKDPQFTGLVFYIGQSIASASNFIDSYINMSLTKQGGSNPPSGAGSNATESFTRGDEIAAGWR